MNTQVQVSTASALAFIAGLLASKFTFFDTNTWMAILTAVGGLVTVVWSAIATRKSAMVSTVANMPQVSTITLNKSVVGAVELDNATPSNVTAK